MRRTTKDERAALIRRELTGLHTVNHGDRRVIVDGLTCGALKVRLRGVVYQDQKRFCADVESLGFLMAWARNSHAWVVYAPDGVREVL